MRRKTREEIALARLLPSLLVGSVFGVLSTGWLALGEWGMVRELSWGQNLSDLIFFFPGYITVRLMDAQLLPDTIFSMAIPALLGAIEVFVILTLLAQLRVHSKNRE